MQKKASQTLCNIHQYWDRSIILECVGWYARKRRKEFTSATADSNGLFLFVFEVVAIFVLYCITADYGINQFCLTVGIHENKHEIHFYATDSNRFTLPHAGVLVARAGEKTSPDKTRQKLRNIWSVAMWPNCWSVWNMFIILTNFPNLALFCFRRAHALWISCSSPCWLLREQRRSRPQTRVTLGAVWLAGKLGGAIARASM